MKKRLNILCVLVILVLSSSVFTSLYYSSQGFEAGLELSKQHTEKKIEELQNMFVVSLLPDKTQLFVDSVYNSKSDSFIPATYVQLMVSVKGESNIWHIFINYLCIFGNLFIILAAIICFIRIIISVNKSDIFIWRNVSRLRKVGVLLIISFLLSLISAVITNNQLSKLLTIKGYSLSIMDHLSITNLVLGIVALIIAEVFAIGLRMKEEQELTI